MTRRREVLESGRLRVLAAALAALAIFVGAGATEACTIVETGTLAAVSNSSSLDCVTVGPFATVTGGIANSGQLSVSSSGSGPTAGVTFFGDTVGQGIVNSGSITAVNTGTGDAAGIAISDRPSAHIETSIAVTGGVSNTGTIAATTANLQSKAVGIDISDPTTIGPFQISGGVSNTGTIGAANTSGGEAGGINANKIQSLTGGISNSGTITARNGINVVSVETFSGGISNTGTINVPVNATSISEPGASIPLGVGINVGFNTAFAGGITNNGTIQVVGQGVIVGISVVNPTSPQTFSGSIVNSGTIFTGNAPPSPFMNVGSGAVGISVNGPTQEFTGNQGYTIVNSGTISAAGGAAIVLQGGQLFASHVTNSGTIIGGIGVSEAPGASITQNGGSIDGAVFLSLNSVFTINGGTVTGDISAPPSTGGVGCEGCPTDALTFAPGSGKTFTYANTVSDVDFVGLSSGTLLLVNGASITNAVSYSQSASATLALQVTPSTSGGPIISGGRLLLAGTLEIVPLAGGYAPTQTYRDIVGGSFLLSPSMFAAVTTSSPLFSASAVADADGVDVTLTHMSPASLPGLTANEAAAGGAVEALSQTGEGAASVIGPIFALDQSGIAQALDELSPRAEADSMDAVQSLFTDISDAVERRLALDDDGEDVAGSGIRIAQLGPVADLPGAAAPWHIWTRGFGGWGDAATTAAAAGFHDQRAGVMAGVDVRTRPDILLGALLAISHTDLHLAGGAGSTSGDSYQGALYAQYAPRPWYANVAAGLGWNTTDESRSIQFPGFAAASAGTYAGQSYSAYGETGYEARLGAATLTPLAGLRYSHLHSDAYDETGAGAADLDVAASDADSLAILTGLRTSARFAWDGMILVPEASAIWQHELMSSGASVTAAFAAAPGAAFTTEGVQFGRDTALLGVGVTGSGSQGANLFVEYQLALNRIVSAQSVSAGVRFSF